MDRNNIEDFKKAYHNTEIPKEIDKCIQISMMKGRKELKKRQLKTKWIKKLNIVAGFVFAFIIGINTIPSFANALYDVPGVGKLVQVVHFDKGNAQGGTITDGTDVKFIALHKEKDRENIIINFTKEDNFQQLVNRFSVDFTEYPYTMTFTIPGTRKFSAEKDFESLKESQLVQDVYKLITLDDSMVRFAVTFKQPVKYEVKEFKEPAQIVVTLEQDQNNNKQQKYSVRSASYPFGESLGMLEERLMGLAGLRILKDQNGTFLVEAGYYNSEEEAKAKIKELEDQYGLQNQFYIEKRKTQDIPQTITQ